MNPERIIEMLREVDGTSEVYQVVARFKLHRKTKEGKTQQVTVEIFDAGPDSLGRYCCVATADDGRKATCNPDTSIEYVLMQMHWHDLDKPARK